MKKIKLIIFSLIITIFKMIFLVPVKVTGGISNMNYIKYSPIFTIKNKCDDYVDGFCYEFLTKRYIIEGIITLIISLLISFIAYKIFQKKKGDKQ